MRHISTSLELLSLTSTLLLFGAGGAAAASRPPQRWLPESCRALLPLEAELETVASGSAEERWNVLYRLGIDAVQKSDLETAERSFCQALEAARAFEPHDIRFAETLDELGLVGYLAGDDARAEAMQGAATAEILLALGPPATDQPAQQASIGSSSVASYLTRLGWVFERQGRGGQIAELERAPYRILARGYVPAHALESRLDWLISRYLLTEDMAAADWLGALRERLRAELAAR